MCEPGGKTPPAIEGTVCPRRRDRARIAWWQLKSPWVMGFGRKHRLRDDRRIAYMYAGLLVLAFIAGAGQSWSAGASIGVAAGWGLTAAALLPTVVLALLTGVSIRPRCGRRWYMTEERDAAIEVAIRGDRQRVGRHGVIQTNTWTVSGHSVHRIGSEAGEILRATLIAPLLAAVDDADDPVYLIAASPQHARLYRTEVDALIDVGKAWPRGRKMYRPRSSDRDRIAKASSWRRPSP